MPTGTPTRPHGRVERPTSRPDRSAVRSRQQAEKASRASARTHTVALLAALAAVVILVGWFRPELSSTPSDTSTETSLATATDAGLPPGEHLEQRSDRELGETERSDDAAARDGRTDGLGTDDGAVPDGTSVFDDVAAIAQLDPGLLDAVREAADDAASVGVRFEVHSGWRSAEYQARLLEEAVAKYGSAEEAARWVATPDTSSHVTGDAIDVGPPEAATWLARNGDEFGLCQIYANEPWHFELRPGAATTGCPAPYKDPTHDPRLQPQ